MNDRLPLAATIFGSAALALPAAAQNVLVVDDDGGAGVDHTQIQAAVDAAGSDDVIVVKDGLYSPVTIDGKSARIYAENDPGDFTGARVVNVVIKNIAADQVVILRGLGVPEFGGVTGVEADDCAGTVWLEDLSVRVGDFGVSALDVDNCAAVVVSDCVFRNPDPVSIIGFDVFGGPGLRAQSSTVHAYDSVFTGGTLAPGGGPGAPGLASSLSFIFASGSSFTGGQGGRGTGTGSCPQDNGGPGGPGIEAFGASEVVLLDTVVAGGPGGNPGIDPCFFGPFGPSTSISGDSTVTDLGLTYPARSYGLTQPAISGTPATLSLTGTPGELSWIIFSINENPTYSPTLSGSIGLDAPLIFVYFSSIPASGTLDIPINVSLPPGKPYLIAYEQGLFFSLEDEFVLGTPRASLILGSAP